VCRGFVARDRRSRVARGVGSGGIGRQWRINADHAIRRSGSRLRVVERQLVSLEEGARGGREAEREDGGVLEGQVAGDGRGQALEDDAVALEGSARRRVAVLVGADRHAEHPVAHSEARDSRADLDDDARDIRADDRRILHPRIDDRADLLQDPVEGVDGHGPVLDHDLVGLGARVGGGPDVEAGMFRRKPGGLVGGHAISSAGSGRAVAHTSRVMTVTLHDIECHHLHLHA
jgi:hypothetical protein